MGLKNRTKTTIEMTAIHHGLSTIGNKKSSSQTHREDAAPVGIAVRGGGFDERGDGDGFGDFLDSGPGPCGRFCV
jgi:hypothetical protein